jgi:hypothetical protein
LGGGDMMPGAIFSFNFKVERLEISSKILIFASDEFKKKHQKSQKLLKFLKGSDFSTSTSYSSKRTFFNGFLLISSKKKSA